MGLLLLSENLPLDSTGAARVGVRRKTSDIGVSATGQGISLLPAGALWSPQRPWLRLAGLASAWQRQHDCAGGTSRLSQLQPLKCPRSAPKWAKLDIQGQPAIDKAGRSNAPVCSLRLSVFLSWCPCWSLPPSSYREDAFSKLS